MPSPNYVQPDGAEGSAAVTASESAPTGAEGVSTGGFAWLQASALPCDLDGGAGNLVVYGALDGAAPGALTPIDTTALVDGEGSTRVVFVAGFDRVAVRVTGLDGGSPAVTRTLRLLRERP